MDGYNGYSGRERDRKYQEYKRLRALGLSVPAVPPCQLCGDPESPVEPHSEDYSMPYLWSPPAEYMICRSCHGWIHKRFNRPTPSVQGIPSQNGASYNQVGNTLIGTDGSSCQTVGQSVICR